MPHQVTGASVTMTARSLANQIFGTDTHTFVRGNQNDWREALCVMPSIGSIGKDKVWGARQ
jgi:hypothetical protein